VPPFSTAEAREIIENELGSPINSIFVNFPSEPIAAASLGQVYRATVRNDDGSTSEVAVKVQRPNIMNQIALDMHLIREVAPFLKRTFNLNTDIVGVVDTWGFGFVDELDYIEEAVNAKSFMEGIASTPLAGVVFSPPVLDELTTRKLLTTEWVIGERLDKSAKGDVSILCSIAMNTYLTMMLETGVLHCDPHPGTIFRSRDMIDC
jgi:predicted unusual protein kinase regulating ubiquinone biosynthesis (AarF/ABC1/UbiB family)